MLSTPLTDLAKTVLENSAKLESFFKEHNHTMPSFDEHYPAELPLSPEMQQVRQKAVDASMELHDLLIGPVMLLRPVLNATSLQAIYKYDIASKVPLDGEISFEDLATATGLKDYDVRRICRFAIAYHRVFQEKKAGFISHSAASRYLAESEDAKAGLGFMFDETYQAFAHTVEAFEKHKDPQPNQSGWAIGNHVDVSLWDHHTAHPHLGERSARAMASFTKGAMHDTTGLVSYDWSSVGTVVDLGGATGHASVAIARAFPSLRCTVQEIPAVVEKAKYQIPEDVADRVTMQAHDFFDAQPVTADVYLFRQIFHNWSDAHCVKMLRALIPALKPGAKVLANDVIMPPPGVLPPTQERGIRGIDMIMMSLFNARERERSDGVGLFKQADERFGEVRMWKPEGSQLGLVEATWQG